MDTTRIVFIHGSESNGQTHKAQIIRNYFPGLISPDFNGPLAMRLARLEKILEEKDEWTLIGSSLGGLIAVVYAAQHPDQVRKLVLLAPALHLPEFSRHPPKPMNIPVILIIGKKDDVIPGKYVLRLSRRIFLNLNYISVDDDHRLHMAAEKINWADLLG